MNITDDAKFIRHYLPTAMVTATPNRNYTEYKCECRPELTDEVYDKIASAMKAHFGDRFIELYSLDGAYKFQIFIRHIAQNTTP